MDRRTLCRQLLIGVAGVSAGGLGCTSMSAQETARQFVDPPGDETASVASRIAEVESHLRDGRKTASAILVDPALIDLHEWPRFRAAIRDHAEVGTVSLAAANEPGTQLVVRGQVLGTDGAPSPNALVYLYQTSARGWYSDRAVHVGGNSGDHKHARLFGYVRADGDGTFAVRSIRPGFYPNAGTPAHIHVAIWGAKDPANVLISEIRFEDCVRMTESMREQSQREGLVVCAVRTVDGSQVVEPVFRLRG